jgi:hypothetical protein
MLTISKKMLDLLVNYFLDTYAMVLLEEIPLRAVIRFFVKTTGLRAI